MDYKQELEDIKTGINTLNLRGKLLYDELKSIGWSLWLIMLIAMCAMISYTCSLHK